MTVDVLDQEQQGEISRRAMDRFMGQIAPVLSAVGEFQVQSAGGRCYLRLPGRSRVWWCVPEPDIVESSEFSVSAFEPPKVAVVTDDVRITDGMDEDAVAGALAASLITAVEARLDRLRQAGAPEPFTTAIIGGIRTKTWVDVIGDASRSFAKAWVVFCAAGSADA